MADNLGKLPVKGILKNSTSFEIKEAKKCPKGAPHFDEMNIIATHHPLDKDYGHMKIEEPKTPYNYSNAESGDEAEGVDPEDLAERIKAEATQLPAVLVSTDEDSPDEEEIEETPEERVKRLEFEKKRKAHYNEYTAVKLAKQLLMDEEDEDDGAENGKMDANKMETEGDDTRMEVNTVD
ncbi:protein phosphatase inhibitor 2-like isoform X1 [Artemia franciscana]|uniref:protein phosphatase inhibitor 2-like isoform X1 n=1 Tax=Artemia franciscana TaxID=6661 RepID=UPI0032DB09FD